MKKFETPAVSMSLATLRAEIIVVEAELHDELMLWKNGWRDIENSQELFERFAELMNEALGRKVGLRGEDR